jgi:integrase
MSNPSHPEAARPTEPVAEPRHRTAAPATLADLLMMVESDPELPPLRRRDLRSSLQTFSRVTSAPLAMVKADPPTVRLLIKDVMPRAAGISTKRWSNIRSDLRFVLARYRKEGRRRLARDLSGAWRALYGKLQEDRAVRAGLSRFFHFCSDHGLAPQQIDQSKFTYYRRWLNEESLVIKPEKVYKRTCQQWNRTVRMVIGWPELSVEVPDLTNRFAFPQEGFPMSFREEVARWAASMAGTDLLGDGPSKPLRPNTVQHSIGQIYRFASALVHRGHDPEHITSLGYLVEIEPFKDGIRFFLDRQGEKKAKGLRYMLTLLIKIAQHWLKVDESELKQLRHLKERVCYRGRGLTEKNRRRLRQFDDPLAQAALLTLPATLEKLARRKGMSRSAARQIQTAMMIELLLHAPIRLANFVALNIRQHFVRRGRAFHLVIPPHDVKNEEPLEFPLPPELVRLFDLYVHSYRPLLLEKQDDGWLWPGRGGGCKHRTAVRDQIVTALRRHAGLEMNPHLFRHLAGKLWLQQAPGNYEAVRRLLGHRSIDTTTMFYTGFDTAAAAKRYHDQVLRARRPRP